TNTLCGAMKMACARGIPEPLPQLQHTVTLRSRQCADGWEGPQPARVVGQHSIDPGLLQHDLTYPDAVRVARGPPRELAVMATIPAQQIAMERSAKAFGIDPR